MSTILIVEDDADTADLLSRYMGIAGHRAVVAGDGREALLAVTRERPDLVLLDVMMPGVGGLTVLRVLRHSRRHAGLPVVLCSALDREELRAAAADAGGATEVLQKAGGFFLDLVDAVRRHLGPASPGPTAARLRQAVRSKPLAPAT